MHKRERWGGKKGGERMMWNRQDERDRGNNIGREKMISVDHVMWEIS